METPITHTLDSSHRVERLAYTAAEVRASLGISNVSLYRLEQRGILVPLKYLRHRLYTVDSIKRFLSGKAGAA